MNKVKKSCGYELEMYSSFCQLPFTQCSMMKKRGVLYIQLNTLSHNDCQSVKP